jgi:hypothetical protein
MCVAATDNMASHPKRLDKPWVVSHFEFWIDVMIPLLEKEGWLRRQLEVAKPPKRRRRGGQFGEIFRPEYVRQADHPGRAVFGTDPFY